MCASAPNNWSKILEQTLQRLVYYSVENLKKKNFYHQIQVVSVTNLLFMSPRETFTDRCKFLWFLMKHTMDYSCNKKAENIFAKEFFFNKVVLPTLSLHHMLLSCFLNHSRHLKYVLVG